MNGTEITMLAIAIVFISFIPFATLRKPVRKALEKWRKRSTTKKVDEGPPKCDICFDDLEGRIATCECGKRFHETCAQPTGSCPYCSTDYSEFTVSESNAICPRCGKEVFGSHCRCGAIIPSAGHLVCICGTKLDQENPKCGKCNRTYVVGNDK